MGGYIGSRAVALSTTAADVTSLTIDSTTTVSSILDQDDMSSNSATALATQQSIKAYVDAQVGTADTLSEVLALGNTTGGTNILFGDSDKAIFGAGSDLQIYHDGSNSFISDESTGNLVIRGSSEVSIQDPTGSRFSARFIDADQVILYHNGNDKLNTTSTGIGINGNATFPDNGKAIFGAGSDLQIYHNPTGSHSYITESGGGSLYIQGTELNLTNAAGNSTYANFVDGGAAFIRHAGSTKLATSASGIDVTGTAVTDGLTVAGNVSVDGGTIKLDGNYPVGTENVALGNTAFDAVTSGIQNTAIGANSMTANTSGTNNTAVGRSSLAANVSGIELTAVGTNALAINTGSYNTAVGSSALVSNTTASQNTAVGYQSLYTNTTGVEMVAVGYEALRANTTAHTNHAFGYRALKSNTTGAFNVAVGHSALTANTTASENTAVGYQASGYNTSGLQNVSLGHNTARLTTTGSYNTSIGKGAMYYNTTGSNNTSVGREALVSNTTSINNTAVGYQAGYSNTTSSGRNAYFGHVAGLNSTGSYNTFIGAGAGNQMTTGTKNTILGRYNGNQDNLDIRTSSNNIVLSDGDGNVGMRITDDSCVRLGTDSNAWAVAPSGISSGTTLSVIQSNSTDVLALDRTSSVDATSRDLVRFLRAGTIVGQIKATNSSVSYNTTSDYRLKENVVDLTGATERLKQLHPKRFSWIVDELNQANIDGFLAHEVQSIVPEAIHGTHNEVDADGNPVYQGIDQAKLVPLLTAALQEALDEITDLKARVAILEAN